MSRRNERLAGFSLIGYIHDILTGNSPESTPTPSPDFFAELEHLLKGITGRTGVYSDSIPAYMKHDGIRSAKLRSNDLSRMAKASKNFMGRYVCGLETRIVRKRSLNKTRIMKYFKATELEWEKWTWHTRNIIRDADTLADLLKLTDEEYEAIHMARKYKIRFGITPYYASLMDYETGKGRDYAVRTQGIHPLKYIKTFKEKKACSKNAMDFMLERNTSPVEGITRRYPKIVILKPILTCPQICVYCQRNWEI